MGRKAVNLEGHRYGRLVVQKRAGLLNGMAAWRCLCDCGEFHDVRGNNLRSGRTTRCPKCARLKRETPLPNLPRGRPRVTVVQLWCVESGQHGGFVRALDREGRVVARSHYSRINLRVRPNIVSTPIIVRLLETLVLLDLVRPRNLGETLTHWLKAQEIELHPMWFTPAERVSLTWFESAHAPGPLNTPGHGPSTLAPAPKPPPRPLRPIVSGRRRKQP